MNFILKVLFYISKVSTKPADVEEAITKLLQEYNSLNNITFEYIVKFY